MNEQLVLLLYFQLYIHLENHRQLIHFIDEADCTTEYASAEQVYHSFPWYTPTVGHSE